MRSHGALMDSRRARARRPKASAPSAAIAPHSTIEPSRRMVGSYGAACRASNSNIGSNSLTPYSWTLAGRDAPAPGGAAVVQERPEPQRAGETLSGRVAVVTGGAPGPGRAPRLQLSPRGAQIALTSLDHA